MAVMAFNRFLENQQQYKSSATWFHVLGVADARGAEILLDYTSDFEWSQEVESYDPQDDSGQVVNHREVVKSAKITFKFLSVDEKVRQLFTGTGDQSLKGKYFGITTQLGRYSHAINTAADSTGYVAWYKCYISQAVAIKSGSNDAGIVVTCYALPNKTCASYTATLPTGTCFTSSAVSAAIAADEFYVTADGLD